MSLHKDSNLSRRCLMLKMLMDQSDNMELLCRPACDGLELGPESITRGFHLPQQRTPMTRRGTVCCTGTLLRKFKEP
jgi:hypothetical protein